MWGRKPPPSSSLYLAEGNYKLNILDLHHNSSWQMQEFNCKNWTNELACTTRSKPLTMTHGVQHLVSWANGPHRKRLREASFRDQPPPLRPALSSQIFWDGTFVDEAIVLLPVGDSSRLKHCYSEWPGGHWRRCHAYTWSSGWWGQALFLSDSWTLTWSSLKPLWWTNERGHGFRSQRSHSVPLMFVCLSSTGALSLDQCTTSISLTSFTFASWHHDPYGSALNTNEPAICV